MIAAGSRGVQDKQQAREAGPKWSGNPEERVKVAGVPSRRAKFNNVVRLARPLGRSSLRHRSGQLSGTAIIDSVPRIHQSSVCCTGRLCMQTALILNFSVVENRGGGES